ncbi:MAG: DUF2844 domain-containing protein [Terriglobales bacterium]
MKTHFLQLPFLKLQFSRIAISVLALAAAIAAPLPAVAALGGDVASVQADQARMKAELRIQTGQAYTVHELHEAGGNVIKEFISPAGKVFAVTWSGRSIPDMRQLLGTYFDQFSQAVQTRARRLGRAPLNIHHNGLVVQSGGHMRTFSGRAYLSDKLPEGVSLDAIH